MAGQMVEFSRNGGKTGGYHAFFNDQRSDVYNPKAAQDAWRRVIQFFAKHL
jgi:dienelactone hydrolase